MTKRVNKNRSKNRQSCEDKAFLKKGALFSLVAIILINVFYIHWCDTKYFFRTYILFGKEIMPELICQAENTLMRHQTFGVDIDKCIFYVCSQKCKHYITEHNEQFARTIDAYSGDSISKSEAILGLQERGNNLIIYFKNRDTFNKYYNRNIQ